MVLWIRLDWDAIEYFNFILFYSKSVFHVFILDFYSFLCCQSGISPGVVDKYMNTSISPY